MRNIEEILVSPTKPWVLVAGFIGGGIMRGILVGILVIGVALFFTQIPIHNPLVIFLFLFLTSLIFSLGGLVNGIYAKSFDGISIIPTFVLTPLVYLGGVFYSVSVLPPIWQTISHFNPIFYVINGFRYGFLGFSDTSLEVSVAVLLALVAVLLAVALYLIKIGLGLRQ